MKLYFYHVLSLRKMDFIQELLSSLPLKFDIVL